MGAAFHSFCDSFIRSQEHASAKFARFWITHLSKLSGDRPASRSTEWNMIVVARATPSLSYFLKCIIIIASCMGSVTVASSFRRWHATSQTRAKIDATSVAFDVASRRAILAANL